MAIAYSLRPGNQHKASLRGRWSKLIEDMGLKGRATVHGLRASFRTWCADTQKDKDQAEFSLAHVKTKLEDAYNPFGFVRAAQDSNARMGGLSDG